MQLIVHGQKPEFPDTLPVSQFVKFDITSVYQNADTKDFLYKSDSEEYFLNRIASMLDHVDFRSVDCIIIDRNLNAEGWVRAVNLAGHIACTQFGNCLLNKLPIVLTDSKEFDYTDLTLKQVSVNNIFQTEGIYFRTHEQLFKKDRNPLTEADEYAITRLLNNWKPVVLNSLNVKVVYDKRHQSTNEWGAMRLAANFGLSRLTNIAYPKHLYFKYLASHIQQDAKAEDKSLHGMFKNVLLIDDNADRGWLDLLKQIFNCPVDIFRTPEDMLAAQNVAPQKFAKYDLILLDLYMESGKATDAHAINLLRFLKKNLPQIPVVIFTASDKAWSLDKVKENGADAMYVKESPLYVDDKNYTKQNFEDFKTKIRHVHDKYQTLAPYWKAIETILSDVNYRSIDNHRTTRLKPRIEERLRMFYGILKKGYEQWDYDKRIFYYSGYELAFITLWSILNEIQEAYYDKKDRLPITGLTDRAGNPVTKQFKSDNDLAGIPGVFTWTVKDQQECYLARQFAFKDYEEDGTPKTMEGKNGQKFYAMQVSRSICGLTYDKDRAPHYFNGTVERESASLELSNQIAFLVLNKNMLRDSVQRDAFMISLFELSKVRNHLFLTHGDTNPGYFASTEQAKRSAGDYNITPSHHIRKLFELVTFLLTGKTITIQLA